MTNGQPAISTTAKVAALPGSEPGLPRGHAPAGSQRDGRHVDEMLLDAFTRARRRFRGAVVAVSERTMITNASASELLQAGERRLVWQWAQSSGPGATEREVPFELASGMTVQGRSYPVECDGCLVGVVLHLRVPAPSKEYLLASPDAGTLSAVETPASGSPAMDSALFTGWSDLTDTERTVAELVGRGLSNKQTGRAIFISPYTVDYHLRRIYRKLGITSRVELARLLGEHYESLAGATSEERVA